MKKLAALSLIACAGAINSQATVLFSDTFDSYSNGNLVGQGPWAQTGTSAVTPVQVASSQAVVGSSGQDVFAPLPGGIYTLADNTSTYIGLDLNVSSAKATGDYFLHTTPQGTSASTTFVGRLEIVASGAGYQIGYLEQSGTGGAVDFGAQVLNFGTSYRVVLSYNDVAGPLNDTASIYVNPTDTTTEANNSPYLANDAWTTTTAESDAIGGINLRQGSATLAPTETVDNLDLATTFSEAATFTPVPTPEPSSMALMSLGGVAGMFFYSRRNKK